MAGKLRRFEESEIVLNQDGARKVLKFFFNDAPEELTTEDRGFAQALLVEAIDASYKVGFIQDLWMSTAKMPQGVVAVIKSFAKKAAKRILDKETRESLLDDPKIYKMVKNTITLKWRSVWGIRMSGGGLMY